MKTFLQVLRLAFWTNPLQRVLTCMGVVLMVADGIGLWRWAPSSPYGVPNPAFPASLVGLILASAVSALMGGVYWRMASAPRIVRLAPRGRKHLLGSVLGMVLLVALLWTVQYWLFFLRWVDPKFHLSLAENLTGMAGSAAFLSMIAVGLFIASRSPLAALLVLLALLSPGVALSLLDVDLAKQVRPAPRAIALLALIWTPFTVWYLNARRISFPGWLASGGQDVLATMLVSSAGPKSRSEALQRQLLGGTTIVRFGAQWFVILGLLLGLQWLLARIGRTDPVLSARVMYASLCICPVVTTVVSFAAIRRSRALWLLTSSTRGEFFACVELILRRLSIAMLAVTALWLAVLWSGQSWRPGAAEERLSLSVFHLMTLWWLGWFAINTQLAGLPKWPVAIIVAGALIAVWGLSAAPMKSHREEAVTGLSVIVLLIGAAIAAVALRWYAQRRWREGDFPRVVTSMASGT